MRYSSKRALALGGACALSLMSPLAGCGWSQRDEFIQDRQVVLTPRPGDGSRISARFDTRPSRTPVAQMAAVRESGE